MSEISESSSTLLTNPADPDTAILSVNMAGITKLTSTNYISWCLQLHLFLGGHDLSAYINATAAPPPQTITTTAGVSSANPKFISWMRQDKFFFATMLGAISTPLQSLVTSASTSFEAWEVLAKTYGTPSRGHIRGLKEQLQKTLKGSKTIDEYMQLMKSKADQLSLLGRAIDHEDFLDDIIRGLPDDYHAVCDAVTNRETIVSFEEFHENLRNREASLLYDVNISDSFPATANAVNSRSRNNNNNWRSNNINNNSRQSAASSDMRYSSQSDNYGAQQGRRPYLGRCQACGKQGHSAQRCYQFCLVQASPQASSTGNWQPRVNVATHAVAEPPSWLLDSGASHHITSNLNNLALHDSYSGSDDVAIGEGSKLGGTSQNRKC
ncbi:hypothetical protein AALP_AA8G210300 [Arabis alpina]|uniref:CCHC-type domain-containing protein n=1 Tax=Arabis alpina TaxID=50452 RepID=A0A087G8F0_ARAAL|nr:hypothetical protein AALP_AA8G210300 [Arabis alpina]